MVSSKLCQRSLHVLELFGQIYEINQHLKVLVSLSYSYLLLQHKSMAQEVLFCMQGCFYLSALSKGFTFILTRSYNLFTLFNSSELSKDVSLPRQELLYVCFISSVSTFQQFTSTHAPGRTSLTFARLAADGHLFISTHIIFATIYSDPMHRAGSWSQLCPNRVVETSKQNSNGEQYFPPTQGGIFILPSTFSVSKG